MYFTLKTKRIGLLTLLPPCRIVLFSNFGMFQFQHDHFMQLLKEGLQPWLSEESFEKIDTIHCECLFIGCTDLSKRILDKTLWGRDGQKWLCGEERKQWQEMSGEHIHIPHPTFFKCSSCSDLWLERSCHNEMACFSWHRLSA